MKTVEPARSMFTPPSAMQAERCVTCGEQLTTRFCPNCGEMRASEREYSLSAFFREHVLEALASLDGRVFRTARMLVRKPGELTAAFMRGSRLPYLPPLQCFLLFNVAFFIWSSLSGSRVLDTPLDIHLHGMAYSEMARRLVAERMARTGMTEHEFAAKFNVIDATQARSLVLAMVPVFALVVGLVTLGRKRRPVVQHLVFSLHSYSFFFLMLPAVVYLIGIPLTLILRALHVTPGTYGYDQEISAVLMLTIGSYIGLSLRRAYQLGWVHSAIAAVVCTVGIGQILQLYRRLLFFVTLNSM